MNYYLYKRPDGRLELAEYELRLEFFPGYEFISMHNEKPNIAQMKLDDAGNLVEDVDKLKAEKRSEIERTRDRALVAPVIVYDGINLDADAQSKSNLADVLAAVNSHIALGESMPPEQMVWKDYDNNIHAFPDIQAYKNWLDGFVIAFAQRNTAVWGHSWQKKSQLDALTTVEDVTAFDPTT